MTGRSAPASPSDAQSSPPPSTARASVTLMEDGTYQVNVGTREFERHDDGRRSSPPPASATIDRDRAAWGHRTSGWDTGALPVHLNVAGKAVALASAALAHRVLAMPPDGSPWTSGLHSGRRPRGRRVHQPRRPLGGGGEGVTLAQARRSYGSPISNGFNAHGVRLAVNTTTGDHAAGGKAVDAGW